MGLLVDGQWHDQWYDTKKTGGRFERKESAFRDWVRADGSTRFAPEAGQSDESEGCFSTMPVLTGGPTFCGAPNGTRLPSASNLLGRVVI